MKNVAIILLVLFGFYLLNTFTQANRDNDGVIVDSGNLDAFSLRVGDCFNIPQSAQETTDGIELDSLPALPCNELHDAEVFQLINFSFLEYPGDDEISGLAREACLPYFESFVGRSYIESDLDIYFLYPTLQSWNTMNDREVVCAIYDMNLTKLQGSARSRGL